MERRVANVLAAASLWALTLLAVSAKAQPIEGEGATVITSNVVISQEQHGGNIVLHLHVTAMLSGVLEGTLESDEIATIHPNGVATLETHGTFTGAASGIEGTLLVREVGVFDKNTQLRNAHFTILDASGDLSGARGHGTLYIAGANGTYSISLHLP